MSKKKVVEGAPVEEGVRRHWKDVEWESREWFELQGGRPRPVGFDVWLRPQQIEWLEKERAIGGQA